MLVINYQTALFSFPAFRRQKRNNKIYLSLINRAIVISICFHVPYFSHPAITCLN